MTISLYFNTQYQKFHARIYHNYKYYHVGRYDDKETAQEEAEKALERMKAPVLVRNQ